MGLRVFDHFGSEPCQWAQEPCAGRHALHGSRNTDAMLELLYYSAESRKLVVEQEKQVRYIRGCRCEP